MRKGIVGPTPERLALAEQVRALRAQGLVHREVAARLGISRSYASCLATDPDGSLDRARKSTYRGTCADCDAPTNGSNGRAGAPKRCQPCEQARAHAERRWTREAVIAAMQRFAAEHGRPPTATDAA